MTNEERGTRAAAVLEVFTADAYGGRSIAELPAEDVFTAAYDLMANLGHFLDDYARSNEVPDRDTFDLEAATGLALYHWREEKSEERDELEELRREAERACDTRGHELTPWSEGNLYRAFADCIACGRGVAVDANPPANGIDIGGEAVAVDCDARRTPFGFVRGDIDGAHTISATEAQLWDWSHRQGAVWPCSDLAEADWVSATFETNGDLVDLDHPGTDELMSDELSAWTSDVREADRRAADWYAADCPPVEG